MRATITTTIKKTLQKVQKRITLKETTLGLHISSKCLARQILLNSLYPFSVQRELTNSQVTPTRTILHQLEELRRFSL